MRIYDINGRKYPSVTTVLSLWYDKIYPKSDESFERYKQLRADIGTLTHKMVEMSYHGHTITDDMMAAYGGESYAFFKQVWPYLKTMPLLHNEAKVHSHILKVAGTVDMVFKSSNLVKTSSDAVMVYDLKTSKKPKHGIALDGYKMQLACYSHCLNQSYGLTVDKAVILLAYPTSSQEIELDRSEIGQHLEQFLKIRQEFYKRHRI